MRRIIKISLSIIFICTCITTYGQNNIRGKVITFGKIPLNNVRITTSKTNQITHTDSLGMFSIYCSDKDKLLVNAEGFDNVKVRLKDLEYPYIDLVYSNDRTSFSDAIHNGHISEEVLSSAIRKYHLKGEKDYSIYNNIYELIDIEIFNVNVNGNIVTTQKQNSLTGSQEVLYVVDGIIVSDISFVVPSNVKSIRYVDGTRAAIYGSQGGNGAIEIILK
ncbi:MAG TPA: hypothetical protein DEQ09_01475 [Bacteroidales bacterium]|nr:hypothetical protein [Bacteroidales bacterium]